MLINFFGFNILTDPVFFARVGLRFGPLVVGPKRYVSCALKPRELPRIDLVLLSHAHMDHMDLRSLRSLRSLNRDTHVVTAKHTADVFQHLRFRNVSELGWEQTQQITTDSGAVTISAFRLRHWGARMRRDTHRTYNAYVLERNGVRICFAGDTARTPAHLLGSRGSIDLMMAPISAYNPWITSHCTPEEAIAMADEANARFLMPVHHETFMLSWEPMEEPIQRFQAALEKCSERIALTSIGQTFRLPG